MKITTREDVEKIGQGLWIEIGKFEEKKYGYNDYLKFSYLIEKSKKDEEIETWEFNQYIDPNPYRDERGFSATGFVEMEKIYTYTRTKDKEIQIFLNLDFISLFKLYRRDENYYLFNENSEEELVVKFNGYSLEVRKDYLKKYLALKDQILVIGFSYKNKFNKIENEIDEKVKTLEYNYWDYVGELPSTPGQSYQLLEGKKIIKGMELEKTGIFEHETYEYEDFIIGVDENGHEKTYTCEKSKLGDCFKEREVDYLTPVFFKKEVLQKFYSNDYIEVEDNYISANGWGLKIDNQRENLVSVYLGDLSEVPYKEQKYWRTFNILAEEEITETSYMRDYMAKFYDPESLDLVFKQKYNTLKKEWKKSFGWELFLDLHEEDMHNFQNLRFPLHNSQVEFDTQLIALTKVLIDSLNEKEILKNIENKEVNGGINRLKEYLRTQEAEKKEKIIKNLKLIQNFRSKGGAHRKGQSYDKLKNKEEFKAGEQINNFKILLEKAIVILEILEEIARGK